MGIRRLRHLAPLLPAPHRAAAVTAAPETGAFDEDAATARRFREQGFVRLDQLVGGEVLRDLQAAFRREQAPAGEAWAAAKRAREAGAEPSAPGQWHATGYYDIPRVLESDPAYLELLSAPRLVALLREVVGPQVTLIHAQARTVPRAAGGGGRRLLGPAPRPGAAHRGERCGGRGVPGPPSEAALHL